MDEYQDDHCFIAEDNAYLLRRPLRQDFRVRLRDAVAVLLGGAEAVCSPDAVAIRKPRPDVGVR